MTKAYTSAYLSGGICGHMWMPNAKAGLPVSINLHGEFRRLSDSPTFEDVARHIIMERGGDFQDARFTADTVIRLERRTMIAPGRYQVRVRERNVSDLPGCADWVDAEAYVGDFLGEED